MRRHVTRQSEQMHEQHGFGRRSASAKTASVSSQLVRTQIVCLGVDVGKLRSGAAMYDSVGRCDKRKRRRDDPVARLYSRADERRVQGDGAVGHGDTVRARRRKLRTFFKAAYERTARDNTGRSHFTDGFDFRFAQIGRANRINRCASYTATLSNDGSASLYTGA